MNLPLCAVSIFAHPRSAAIALTLLPLVVLLLFLLTGSSVVRRRNESFPETAASSAAGRDDNRYWFARLIYFNPGDPALLVMKRSGRGRTLNFGHWASWLITIALLSIPLLVQFVAGHPGRH